MPTRPDSFSGRMLVLRIDHGRQSQDGASLAREGSEAIQLCSDRFQTSYDSGRMLVLRMDHDRQSEDGASLAGAGSEAMQLCSDRPQTSCDDWASLDSGGGYSLLGVFYSCPYPSIEG